MFGHEPSNQSCEFDFKRKKLLRVQLAAEHHHFYGHGGYSPDGRFLYSTENNYEKDFGVINIRDEETMKIVDQFSTFGTEPHEILFLSDGKTAVAANGGIRTRPDVEGGKKALGDLNSSVTWVDLGSKKLIQKTEIPSPGMSLRHLAQLNPDLVAVAIQDKSFGTAPGGLIVLCHRTEGPQMLATDPQLRKRMNHHTLSIRKISPYQFAVTSPNGSLVTFWNSRNGSLEKEISVPKASGLAWSVDSSISFLTGHDGELFSVNSQDFQLTPLLLQDNLPGELQGQVTWGSHLTAVRGLGSTQG